MWQDRMAKSDQLRANKVGNPLTILDEGNSAGFVTYAIHRPSFDRNLLLPLFSQRPDDLGGHFPHVSGHC
jgi:hypothetical protein